VDQRLHKTPANNAYVFRNVIYIFEVKKMIKKISTKAFLAIFFVFSLIAISSPVKAEETGLPTIKNPTDNLQVRIPGMKRLSEPTLCGDKMCNNWVGEYIASLYNYAIAIVGIIATVTMMFGGLLWLTSAGNATRVSEAKAWIGGSITGLVLMLASYTVMQQINADIITSVEKPLAIQPIEKAPTDAEEEEVPGSPAGATDTYSGFKMDLAFAQTLSKIKNEGVNFIVTDGMRTLDEQIAIIKKNCGGYPPTKACTTPTCLLKKGAESCPHTTGRAIDAWGAKNGRQSIMKAECQKNLTACFNNPEQKALIDKMRYNGFCVLSNEPWHFEKPKMSSKCI